MNSQSTAAVEVGNSANILMQIQTMCGEASEMHVPTTITVLQAKDRISTSSGVPCVRQKLLCGEEVMKNQNLVGDYCGDNASVLKVTLIVSEFEGIIDELVAWGLTQQVEALSPSDVHGKLDTLSSSMGGLSLPEHVSQWFSILMERGIALKFPACDPHLDISMSLESAGNSPGLLHLFNENQNCEFAWAQNVYILDLTSEEGALLCYYTVESDDFFDGPASDWKALGRLRTSHSNLTEYFLFNIAQAKEKEAQRKQREEQAQKDFEVSEGNTRLIVSLWKWGQSGCEPELGVITPKFVDCTIADLKETISEMAGVPVKSQSIKYWRKELSSDFMLSKLYKGGSRISVWVS